MSEPRFNRLAPGGDPLEAVELLATLAPWDHAPADRPRVLCNMVATLDGRVTIGGRSGPIGGPGDHAFFHGLRTIVDAILVGTGTLRAERYGRMVRKPERRARRAALGLAEDPAAVIITRTGQVPWDIPLFEAPEQHVIVATTEAAAELPDGVPARVDFITMPAPTPRAVMRALRAEHGIRSILCEGGPTLNRSLIADGVLDELFLTLGPLLVGGELDILRILADEELPEPARMSIAWVLQHDDEVYLRYVAAR